MKQPRRRYVMRTPRVAPGVEAPGHRELLAVREIVHAFLHADRIDEAFQFALDRVSPVVGASLASVYLVDGASELMRLTAAHNWPERLRPWLADVRVRVGFGPSGEAASERRMIEVPNVFTDPDLEDWQEVARELGFTAIVALPLQVETQAVGAVTFYFRSWEDFAGERRGLLRLVADLMAAASEKAKLSDRVRRAEAAAVEALTELDKQYVAVANARRSARGLIDAAIEALRPAVDSMPENEGAAARAVFDDLTLIAAIEDGAVEATADVFDPRTPLREAMHAVAPADGRVHLVAQEPIHDLPSLRSDAEKLGVALARLLSRAARFAEAAGETEVRAAVTAAAGRVEYRIAGREGADVEWRVATAIAELLGGRIEVESSELGATTLLSLPSEPT